MRHRPFNVQYHNRHETCSLQHTTCNLQLAACNAQHDRERSAWGTLGVLWGTLGYSRGTPGYSRGPAWRIRISPGPSGARRTSLCVGSDARNVCQECNVCSVQHDVRGTQRMQPRQRPLQPLQQPAAYGAWSFGRRALRSQHRTKPFFFWKAYLPIENTLNGKRPSLVHRPRAGSSHQTSRQRESAGTDVPDRRQ